jgi:phosphate:Na+ symporter
VEAVRRTVARTLVALCGSLDATLAAASRGESVRPRKDTVSVPEAADALRRAQAFMSDVNGPPESEDEQRRLTSTLHALEHASRLAETAGDEAEYGPLNSGPDDVRAAQLCAEAMRNAASVAGEVAAPPAARDYAGQIESWRETPPPPDGAFDRSVTSTAEALVRLQHCANTLDELQRSHRSATLGAVANGALTASEAIIRVDTVRRLDALAHHAWRSAAQLVGRSA